MEQILQDSPERNPSIAEKSNFYQTAMKNLGSSQLLGQLDCDKAKETIENKLRESQDDLDLIFQQYKAKIDIQEILHRYSKPQEIQYLVIQKQSIKRYTLNPTNMNRSLSSLKKIQNKQQNRDLGLKSSLSWFDEMTGGKSNQFKEKLQKIVLKRAQNKHQINPMSALDLTQEEKQELNSKILQTFETTLQTLHQPEIQNSESIEFIEFQKNFKANQMLLNAIVATVLIAIGLCLFRLI